jgi:predicted O-methyltransferase YrrM
MQRGPKDSRQKTADNVDAFNEYVKNDPRVEAAVLPIFDGLSIIMRKLDNR